jgi:hypothetical protein
VPKRAQDDPDETEGRALYRAIANKVARYQVSMASRRVRLAEPAAGGMVEPAREVEE